MGSFNTTCFASGQTIAPREACYLLPIIQAHTYDPIQMTLDGNDFERYGAVGEICYPHAFWKPYGGFIEAKYDDCGSVELADTPINRQRLFRFFLELLFHAAVVPQGKNTYHDVPFNMPEFIEKEVPELYGLMQHTKGKKMEKEYSISSPTLFAELEKTWAYVADAAHEFRLFAIDRGVYPFQVSFAVLHGVAYNNLIAMLERKKSYKGEPLDRRSFFDRAIAPEVEKSIQTEKALRQKIKEMEGDQEAPMQEAKKLLLDTIFNRENLVYAGLSRMGEMAGSTYPSEGFETIGPICNCSRKDADINVFFEELKPTLDARYVIAALEALNLHLTPMVYAGQDYSNALGNRYAKFVQATREVVDEERRNRG